MLTQINWEWLLVVQAEKKNLGPHLGSVEKSDGLVMSAMDAEPEDVGMTGIYHSCSLAEEA